MTSFLNTVGVLDAVLTQTITLQTGAAHLCCLLDFLHGRHLGSGSPLGNVNEGVWGSS